MFRPVLATFFLLIPMLAMVGAAEDLPDPTRPLEYGQREVLQSTLVLHSILIAEGRRVAIINDKQVTEQQWIGDKQVLKILADRVLLGHQGQEILLRLHSSNIRQ